MESSHIRDQIQVYVNQLSFERLQVALSFLSDLAEREIDEATQEILAIPNIEQDLAEAENQVKTGRLVDWRTVRDDV